MPQVLSVSEVNNYIKSLVAYDMILSSLWVKGEISNYKRHYSGHLYFTIKDKSSMLKCVMFKTNADKLIFEPENGMQVMVRGSISVFERDGVYQLYAEVIKTDGIGDLHAAFEQLKAKLSKEGLFDSRYKKQIPFMPKTIGVITSETGSVIRDILNVVERRFPAACIRLMPTAVQGAEASKQIAEAVDFMNRNKLCDVIIIARGGGSLEELWPFNEEIVARAVFNSVIPVISSVGHETDYTICDYVADLRAPTPSAAAELAVPELSELLKRLRYLKDTVMNIPARNIQIKKQKLEAIKNRSFFRRPGGFLEPGRQYLINMENAMVNRIERCVDSNKHRVAMASAKLDLVSPLKVLAKGYGITTINDKVLKSVDNVTVGDEISTILSDGLCKSKVIRIEKEISRWKKS